MRIVYVLTTLGMGGAEKQVLAIAERMQERGHTVLLLILRPQLEQEWPTQLPIERLAMHRKPLSFFAGLMRGREVLRRFRPNIVHSHSFHSNIAARLLRSIAPTFLLISTVHNVYEGGRLRMVAYRITDRLSRMTTFVSQAAADRFVELRAVSRKRMRVITNGIDAEEFSPNHERRDAMRGTMDADRKFIWLTAGRITPAKDLPNLFRAFSAVCESNDDTELWIAGQLPDSEAGLGAIELPQLDVTTTQRVRWLGLRRDLPALLDAADGFVLGSAWEGMPLVVGEAMAMEKPVVATDVGGTRELVGDCGLLVASRDSEALAVAMMRVMKMSEDDQARIGMKARMRIVENFSIETRADEWEMLYAGCLLSSQR